MSYDSLVIYDFDYRMRSETDYLSIIDEAGQLPPTVKKSVRLSNLRARELSERLEKTESYGQLTAACFTPHFGMVYYRQGEAVAHVTLCLGCNYLRASSPIQAMEQCPETYEDFTYYRCSGFSSEFRKYLSELKQEFAFSHYNIESSLFD